MISIIHKFEAVCVQCVCVYMCVVCMCVVCMCVVCMCVVRRNLACMDVCVCVCGVCVCVWCVCVCVRERERVNSLGRPLAFWIQARNGYCFTLSNLTVFPPPTNMLQVQLLFELLGWWWYCEDVQHFHKASWRQDYCHSKVSAIEEVLILIHRLSSQWLHIPVDLIPIPCLGNESSLQWVSLYITGTT